MLISVDLKGLRDHLEFIQRQRDEVYILLDAVHEWESVASIQPEYNAELFLAQYAYLHDQLKWIDGRYRLIESMIEHFSTWARQAGRELTDAKRVLNVLSDDSL